MYLTTSKNSDLISSIVCNAPVRSSPMQFVKSASACLYYIHVTSSCSPRTVVLYLFVASGLSFQWTFSPCEPVPQYGRERYRKRKGRSSIEDESNDMSKEAACVHDLGGYCTVRSLHVCHGQRSHPLPTKLNDRCSIKTTDCQLLRLVW